MKAKLPYTLLRDQIYTHPIMTEALKNVIKSEKEVVKDKSKQVWYKISPLLYIYKKYSTK